MASDKTSQGPTPIDLVELWKQCLRVFNRIWLVVLVLGILGGSFFFLRAKKAFVPMYESKALFSVNSGQSSDDIFTANYYDNAAAKQLAEAFPYMLSTDLMQDMMKQELGKPYINGSITPSALASTNLFSLSVRSSSPEDAHKILWATIEVFPQVATYMVDYPQIIILEEPSLPENPYNSFNGLPSAVKGGLLGIGVGLFLIVLLALFTASVYSVQQLKQLVNLPILATFPAIEMKKRRSGQKQFLTEANTPEIRESIRGLNRKAQKFVSSGDNRVIVVTSALKGEGKTTIATNLAMSLAKDGYRVALVDGDLRSQGVSGRFSMENGRFGLLDCMRDPKLPVLQCLVQVPDKNIWILSGSSNLQRNYSIDPKGMRRVLESLRKEFDYVVMDTSPCALVSESVLLCHYAGAVIFVVRAECASKALIVDTVNELYDRGVTVAGLVYNGAQLHTTDYGYGYKYGYGYGYKYGYGYGYGYSNKKRK